jgi:hypothetical protein
MKSEMTKNIEIFNNLYDKNKTYCSMLELNIHEQLKKYHIEVIGLKDIFDRKDKLEFNFKKFKSGKLLNLTF